MATRAPLHGEPLPVELMNTRWADRDGVHDALGTDGEARDWVAAVAQEVGAWAAEAPAARRSAFLHDLREIRGAARALAARATDDPRPEQVGHALDEGVADPVAVLNRLARTARPVLTWPATGDPVIEQEPDGDPGDRLLSRTASGTMALLADPETPLRACLAPGCVLYFVRQHRREWCSAGCGNRARQARHYRRHRG